MNPDDAEFILKLVNDPAWIQFIGDKGIKSVAAARDYLLRGPIEMYAQLGFGLWMVELKRERIPIGISGLIKPEIPIGIRSLFSSTIQSPKPSWAYISIGPRKR